MDGWARARGRRRGLLLAALLPACAGLAQIDPELRRVFQGGYAMPLHEHGPIAAYGYYYHNQPGWQRTNLTLRTAVVPVYLDAELGVGQALGPHTDLGLGLSGGGFADSYSELRQGDFKTGESFTGHSGEASVSVYHLFNPANRMPLYGIARGAVHGSFYSRDDDTDPAFTLPDNRGTFSILTGLRLGGREPYLSPALAAEISVWYEGQFRTDAGPYGFNGDRQVKDSSHLFWARALLAYTFEESRQYFEISLTGGGGIDLDRFSAWRLGGSLPLLAEFPLTLPGYHSGEISAEKFGLIQAAYHLPLGRNSRWLAGAFGSVAVVDYLDGLEQPGRWHSGVGGGLIYRSRSNAWQIGAAWSYGVQAIREHGEGAHTFTVVAQYDLDALERAGGKPFWNPMVNSSMWRGLVGLFRAR
jgi:hypothetical protein